MTADLLERPRGDAAAQAGAPNRRVVANAATAIAAQMVAASLARDVDALPPLADAFETVHHPTGTVYEREGLRASFRSLFKAHGGALRIEPLATLGDSLALGRQSISAARFVGGSFDVGAYAMDGIGLVEADPRGQYRRGEIFAPDRLGDAVARLYERHAELLPEGPERTRAAATARVIALWNGPLDLDSGASALASTIEIVDHRILGTWSARGAEEVLRHWRSQLDLAADAVLRDEDVLALRPDALLTRRTYSGTDRAGGGAYEDELLVLHAFDVDGLIARVELFGHDRDAEALARFDQLTAVPPAARSVRRRVRPNAATANAARYDAAMAARDADAAADLYAEGAETVHHPTGVTYDRDALVTVLRDGLATLQDLAHREEPLASLGESLALFRTSVSAAGFADSRFDVAHWERESVNLVEVDAHGRRGRTEVFSADRLGDAVARLYARYAEIFLAGPERTRADAVGRFVTLLGSPDPDLDATALARDIEVVDHRTLGMWPIRGAEGLLQNVRAWFDLADGITNRLDDVLGLRSDALLARWTLLGNARAGGGAHEIPYVLLSVVQPDGLVSRWELFDPDREAEALARFEKLGAEGQAEPFENAASRNLRRFEQRWHERDWEGVVALLGPGYRVSDRRSLVGMELEGEEGLRSLRMTFDVASGRWSSELLATRGERLALFRRKFEGEVGAVGPFENPRLSLIETGADGRRVLQIHFDPDDLDTAYGELDARYAAGEAAPWARTWSALGRLVTALNARDREELARTVAPDLVWRDHRILGLHELRSRDEYLERFRALVELAPDVALRVEHVLGLDDRGVLAVLRLTGHREGGPFEIPSINVMALDAGGRFREYRTYDLEELDTARAGFAEIMAAPPARPVGKGAMLSSADAGRDPLAALARPNAASAAMDRVQAAFEARDWARLRALAEEGARFEDRRRHALLSGDRDWWVANLRLEVGESGLGHFQRNLVATAGDRVCLERVLWRGGPAQGRVEIEYLWLAEVDEGGRLVAGVMFDAGDWRAASREGWNRWLARDAAAAAVMGPIFEFVEGWNDHDRARLRAVLEDDVVSHDRQLTGHGLVEGADAYLDVGTAVWALARDAQLELRSVLALDRHGGVGVSRTFGTLPEGGDFEIQNIDLVTVDRGRITRIENFEIDALDAALARFEELRPTASS
jgi:hypothetical protein